MIKAIIFDMDGVLIDAKDWHYEALNRALGLFGYTISRYEHLTTFDGLPTSKKLEMLSVESGLPRELHAFINEMKQAYTMEMVYARCKPVFVHEYALSTLKSMNYRLAVASNSIRNSVDVMIERAGINGYFDVVLSASDVACPKPDPEIYVKAIGALRCSPEECLIVEDNENGVRAAKASGAHLLQVHSIFDVNFDNIVRRIADIERGAAR